MNILLYVTLFVTLLSISFSSFIKRGRDHLTLSSYYTSYFSSLHELQCQSAKAVYKKLKSMKQTKAEQTSETSKNKHYPRRGHLKNSSRFNLAFLFEDKINSLPTTMKIFKALYHNLPLTDVQWELFLKDLQKAGRTCKMKNEAFNFKVLRLNLEAKHAALLYELLRGYIHPKDSKQDRLPLEHYVCLRNSPYALFIEQAHTIFLEALFPKESVEALTKKEKEIKEKKEDKLSPQAIEDILCNHQPINETFSDVFEKNISKDHDRIAEVIARQNGITLQHMISKET